MRLDKFICDCTELTRSQAGKVIRQGLVTVDQQLCKQPSTQVTAVQQIELDGELLKIIGLRYFVMHKPAGYVCSTDDPDHNTVFTLMDEPMQSRLHTVGRLDLDTTGLLLITDDGQWSHQISSPKHECAKTYRAWLADPVDASAITLFAEGVMLNGEKHPTKPAQLEIVNPQECLLTIHEGRYHQVKRMFAAIGNKVEKLHREQIGSFKLGADLAEGSYRELTLAEATTFAAVAK
ncbi:16S rRNA pseudouridine(516) synthase RsuA [Rheinheimera riviphila]|uniref:Pseudouridine synthase n=1 Tax=Rheinheimera riviphila TaxID=1834037 RepID=A0A437QIU2_9GAMM|nr:16S rRNA pseudouridine(516) synthase RsuA [Rheinheimera riviphila]RVU34451.1 16S rRNA pseudouridine(516) synthase RsuA [Rheinheimera riviphila]